MGRSTELWPSAYLSARSLVWYGVGGTAEVTGGIGGTPGIGVIVGCCTTVMAPVTGSLDEDHEGQRLRERSSLNAGLPALLGRMNTTRLVQRHRRDVRAEVRPRTARGEIALDIRQIERGDRRAAGSHVGADRAQRLRSGKVADDRHDQVLALEILRGT